MCSRGLSTSFTPSPDPPAPTCAGGKGKLACCLLRSRGRLSCLGCKRWGLWQRRVAWHHLRYHHGRLCRRYLGDALRQRHPSWWLHLKPCRRLVRLQWQLSCHRLQAAGRGRRRFQLQPSGPPLSLLRLAERSHALQALRLHDPALYVHAVDSKTTLDSRAPATDRLFVCAMPCVIQSNADEQGHCCTWDGGSVLVRWMSSQDFKNSCTSRCTASRRCTADAGHR